MHLARILLNARSRDVARDLRDRSELHRTVMKLFPNGLGEAPRKTCSVLHRVDLGRTGQALLVVQSSTEPDLAQLPSHYAVDLSDIDGGYPRVDRIEPGAWAAGDRLVFRLVANVTRKILTKSLSSGEKQNGKRVPLRSDQDRIDWLKRKAETGGFAIVSANVRVQPDIGGRPRPGGRTFAAVQFDGELVVRAADTFRRTVANGIGPGKAFGFGLLSVGRAIQPAP